MTWQRSRGDGCLSDLRIDRLIRGELAAEAADEARGHVATCEACRARLAEVEGLRAVHRASAPPLRAPVPRRRRWGAWVAGASTALAAAAALVLMLRPADDGTRVKGGGRSASLFVEHAGETRRAAPGELVAPGDTLQLQYSSATRCYGAVLSLDGARHPSRYFPDSDRAALLEPGQDRSFPASTVLDAVPGREAVYVLLCDEPIALAALVDALPARPPSPSGCTVQRFDLEKRGP